MRLLYYGHWNDINVEVINSCFLQHLKGPLRTCKDRVTQIQHLLKKENPRDRAINLSNASSFSSIHYSKYSVMNKIVTSWVRNRPFFFSVHWQAKKKVVPLVANISPGIKVITYVATNQSLCSMVIDQCIKRKHFEYVLKIGEKYEHERNQHLT